MFRYFFLIFFIPSVAFAQFTENWTRSNLDAAPQWIGDTDCFIIDSDAGCLHLNAPEEASESSLFIISKAIEDASWQFEVSYDFNPSSSNYCLVYLCVNQSTPTEGLEGYFVKIGDKEDEVSLWKTIGGVQHKIIDGRDKVLDFSSCKVSVKVSRDKSGNWTLDTCIGEGEFVNEGKVCDNELYQSKYFGIYCKYTATRSQKFHFGSIQVSGNAFQDVEPPKILSHELIKGECLKLIFSEEIENQTITGDKVLVNGDPAKIGTVDMSGFEIIFDFEDKVQNAEHGEISISGFKDLYGNAIRDTILYYSYFKPERYDLIITEIMVDPDPLVGLPNCEYVEIYNYTSHSVNLNGYKLYINSKESELPSYNLNSNEYLILTNSKNEGLFSGVPFLLVEGMGEMTNSRGDVVLVNDENQVSDALNYPFKLDLKNFKWDGGWSIEKKGYGNFDLSGNNWCYSMDLMGGTPGEINSVCCDNVDISQPTVKYVSFLNDSSFQVQFSEAINPSSLVSFIQVEVAQVRELLIDSVYLDDVRIGFSETLQPGKTYELPFDQSIADIAGNGFKDNYDWRLGIPEMVDSFDVCISEVLFNPESGGFDFVEIYNRSEKIININDLYVSTLHNGVPEKLNKLDDKNLLMFPGDYWVLCEDTSWLINKYKDCIFQRLVECDLPSLNDDEGNLALVFKNGKLLDYLEYSEDMHFALLDGYDGVSLEKIDLNRPTNNQSNWHSASGILGYATPTYKNSQNIDSAERIEKENWIWLNEDVFSPNGDGDKDYLVINYRLPDVGYSGTIKVYDRDGRPVATLINNALMDVEGFIKWDGVLSSHIKAPLGIYLLYAEVFSLNGDVKKDKLVCVVNAGMRK